MIRQLIRDYNTLTKLGIILFSMVTAMAGYSLSYELGRPFEWSQPILFLFGLYFVCAGSFALNQTQEHRQDAKMKRTKSRPVARGALAPWQGALIGVVYMMLGLGILYLIKPLTASIALFTILLYNGVYTMWWKRKWAFAAVPGAIPGALPVVIGYSVNSDQIFSSECIYLFMVMFLWQMPHFWCLAIRYKDDYKNGGFPVLPAMLGVDKTMYHIGLYVFAYVGVALTAPFFLQAHLMHLLLVIPIGVKVVYEFFKYFHSYRQKRWLPFFLWVNLSMLVFLAVPVFDRWAYYLVLMSSASG